MKFEDVTMSSVKTCIGCGNTFDARFARQTRCTKDCGRASTSKNGARAIMRDEHDVQFIAVDGEGVSRYRYYEEWDEEEYEFVTKRSKTKEIQDYVLLSVGDKSLHNNGKPLHHIQIFEFLYDQFLDNPDATFIGFYLGYDFTMWLKTLPQQKAWQLLHREGIAARKPKNAQIPQPWPVRDGGYIFLTDDETVNDEDIVFTNSRWEFDILGMKRFKLRPYVRREDYPICDAMHKTKEQIEECATGAHNKHPYNWMYINDVGPFFQMSFLKVIAPFDKRGNRLPDNHPNRVLTDEEYAIILEGKEDRSSAQFDEAMIKYNLLENDVLSRVMRQLNLGFVHDEIRLKKDQWYGPGQAAQAWLRLINAPTSDEVNGNKEKGIVGAVPSYFKEAARKSYYGGWFEIFNHGPVPGTSYEYDINSAYPSVIASLPCLLHGQYSHGTGKPGRLPKGAIRLLYGTFYGKDQWVGPLPYREEDQTIKRPLKTKGWYWEHEVRMSEKAGLLYKKEIEEWVMYRPCDCPPPMRAIHELYNGRLEIGKDTPQGKAKKTIYNSAYGKFAQSIGSPRFSNPVYGSLITAGCRTKILEAIATHPTKSETLLMVATDGIYFKEPHPNLDIDDERLGAWGMKTMENLSLFMPGVYWDDKARETIRQGKTPALKSRGVNAKHLATIIDIADKQWSQYGPDVKPPEITIRIDWALIGAKQAVVRGKWKELCGKNEFDILRKVNADPSSKRNPDLYSVLGGLRSIPYPMGMKLETTYYEPRMGDNDEPDNPDSDEDRYLTPDGMVGDLRAQAFGLRG